MISIIQTYKVMLLQSLGSDASSDFIIPHFRVHNRSDLRIDEREQIKNIELYRYDICGRHPWGAAHRIGVFHIFWYPGSGKSDRIYGF